MRSSGMKVCVRTRPTANFAEEIVIKEDEVTVNKKVTKDTVNNALSKFGFKFDKVLHNASQEHVYDIARDVVQGVVEGTSGTIMTYGQTGSGKSFTLLGDMENYAHRGVAPRAIAHLFSEIGARIELEFEIFCSYFEIYNERIYDLLRTSDQLSKDLTIAECRGRGVFVRGLEEVSVKNERDALNLLYTGQLARTTAQHKLNHNSNRSHSIFTIVLRQQSRSGVAERIMTSKLNLVDLAGSERLKKTMDNDVDSTLKKESMHINRSLTYLEQCVVALGRHGPGGAIAYRQTKLTAVLKDALGGNCATLLLACIWSEAAHLEETLSTLRLASRMTKVKNDARPVTDADPSKVAKRQELRIRDLQQELLLHNVLAERTVKYDRNSADEQELIAAKVRRYVEADDDDDDDDDDNTEKYLGHFESVRQIKETCAQFKKLFKKNHTDRRGESAGSGGGNWESASSKSGASSASLLHPEPVIDQDLVGEPDPNKGFGLGLAADGATKIRTTPKPLLDDDVKEIPQLRSDDDNNEEPHDKKSNVSGPSAWEAFTQRPQGAAFYDAFLKAKAAVTKTRSDARTAVKLLNQAKQDIDTKETNLKYKQSRRGAVQQLENEDVIDEEEFQLLKDERAAKGLYRERHATWTRSKAKYEAARLEAQQTRTSLVDAFQAYLGNLRGPNDDKLDDQEQFEKMELDRVVSEDPDSLAFFQAQKTRRAAATQHRTELRQLHRSKRA